MKYLSVLFGLDDSFDTDEGYQGKGQFLFTMLGTKGNHGTEMNAHTEGSVNAQPRSHPQFYGMTIIGGGSSGKGGGLMRIRGGSGGKFGNIMLLNVTDKGFRNDACGQELRTASLPSASQSIGTVGVASSGYLYWSSNNIIHGASQAIDDDCTPSNSPFTYVNADPLVSAAGAGGTASGAW